MNKFFRTFYAVLCKQNSTYNLVIPQMLAILAFFSLTNR
jgi:hypothetical protein